MSTENETKESEFYIIAALQENRRKIESRLEELNTRHLKKITDAGREFAEGVQGDLRKMWDNILGEARKIREKLPLIDRVEKKATDSWNAIKEKFDLPTKEEMDRLAGALETLHQKVDAIKQP